MPVQKDGSPTIERSPTMKRHLKCYAIVRPLAILTTVVGSICCSVGQNASRESLNPQDTDGPSSRSVTSRQVDIWSDGTRLSGDLLYLASAKAGHKLLGVILCHGWGGLRSHLNAAYAPHMRFSQELTLRFTAKVV